MSKSRARFLSELLGTTGLVKKSKSALAGADEIIDLSTLPSIPNSKLTNSSITINSNATSLGGSVTLTTANVAEGSNLYYTDARADARIAAADTGDLSEGSNLYYTNARADARVNLQTGSNLDLSSKDTGDLSEGSNLYYTNARADARIAAATTDDLSEGSSNLYYTDARADARVALVVDSTPSTLNTLNELAAALGDDANFSTTVTNSIAAKLPLAGGTMTGTLNMGANAITSTGTISSGAITSTGKLTLNDASVGGWIQSNRSIRLDIDNDNDQTDRAFIVSKNNGTTDLLTILEDASATFSGTISSGAISSTGTIEQYDTYNDASKFLGNKLVADAGSTSFTHPYLDMRRWTGVSGNHYVASIELAPTNADAGSIVFYSDTKSSNTKATTERMRINSSGNVGIGTDNPFTRAVVGDGSGTEVLTIYSGSDGEGQIRFADGNSGSAAYQGRVEYDHVNGRLNLGAGGTTPFTLDANGNVGIGTDSPDALLHVSDTSPHIDIGPQGGNRGKIGYHSNDVIIGSTSSTGNIIFKNNISSTDSPQTSGDVKMTIADVGLTIHSDTYNILNLQTDSNNDQTSTDGIIKITNNDGSSDVTKAEFRWDESEDLVHVSYGDHGRHISINSTGKVGIGTGSTSPTATLEVAGTALVENAKLKAIAESNTDTAVDVFVYDTRKDSDGGAWRNRTQHTSWYNETLNTSLLVAQEKNFLVLL